MTATAAIGIPPPVASAGQWMRGSTQGFAARQNPRGGWETVYRSMNVEAAPAQPAIAPQPQNRAKDSSPPDSSRLAQQNPEPPRPATAGLKQPSGANSNASLPPKPQNAQEESANGVDRKADPASGASLSAPSLDTIEGSTQPAEPSIAARRANASPGEPEPASDHSRILDAKKLQPASTAPGLTTAAMVVAPVAIPSPPAQPVAAQSPASAYPEPISRSARSTAGSIPPLPGLQVGNASTHASSAGATTSSSNSGGWKTIADSQSGSGTRAWNAGSSSAPSTEHISIARGFSGAPSTQPAPAPSAGTKVAGLADEASPAMGAGPGHTDSNDAVPISGGEATAARPRAWNPGSLPAANAAGAPSAASPPAETGAVSTVAASHTEPARSLSTSLNISSAPEPASAGHETTAKARPRAAGEGMTAAATTQATSVSMAPTGASTGPGTQSVSFVPREPVSYPAAGQASAYSGNEPAVSAHEAFTALDTEVSPVAPTWVHAAAQHAEAGFEDPALGWVAVRADLGSGGVHASLVPGSTDAAQTLGSHLAGLNAYLAEHHAGVSTVTLSAPEGRPASAGNTSIGSGGDGLRQSSGGQSQQGSSGGKRSDPPPGAAATVPVESMPAQIQAIASAGGLSAAGPAWMEPGAGVHVSVLA